MQLVATEYLFIHFPDHHEGHLTVRSNHLNNMSSHTLPQLYFFFFISISASLHLCFVFILSLCFCSLKLLAVPRFLHEFTWSEVTAVKCFFFHSFLSIFESLSASQQLFTPFLFRLFPQNDSPPLLTPDCAYIFTVLLVVGIVMRHNCSVVFNNTSLLAHFCQSCQVSEK